MADLDGHFRKRNLQALQPTAVINPPFHHFYHRLKRQLTLKQKRSFFDTAAMIEVVTTNHLQRERSRSPRRRSRSPRRSRRSYSPRSRSRSRERERDRDEYRRSERRSRSPMTSGAGAAGGYSGSSYGRGGGAAVPARSFEERAQAKEQMMASVRESSQQERRVYVGNLSYDVKWHHLKDFMRQG